MAEGIRQAHPGLAVPGAMKLRTGRTPTVHDYVASFLRQMRAPLRERTTFTPAGRTVIHSNGERVLYAPDGTPIRVVEIPGPNGSGGNQIEHGDHLHAHVRPETITRSLHDLHNQ